MNTKLYLIRHCRSTGQEPDAVLTADGEKQAEKLADFLGDALIERIVSSPFVRAVQSIKPLAHRLRLQVETDPRLQERVLSSSHLPNWRENLRQTFEQLDLRFPGGESSREAMQRASTAVQDIFRKTPTGVIAVVSHGNLSTLLLKQFDESIGFSTWESMTTPDVFCLHLGETGTPITRLWPSDRMP
jgi:2,3-bisphosphoglycerate-dependent phosphoglycerate mutase